MVERSELKRLILRREIGTREVIFDAARDSVFFFFVCRAIISRRTTIIARDIFVRRVFYSVFWSSGAELGMVDREIDEHVDLLPQVWPADGHAVAER